MARPGNTKGITREGGIIQHKCGVPDKPESRMKAESDEVEEAFRAFFSKKGRKVPEISRCFVVLSEEQQEAMEAY